MYNTPSTFFSMLKRYMGQNCMNSVSSGKVQFLKNWNNKGKRHIQNTGKHTVNKLHKVACEILKHPDTGYTSHTWRWFATTNLAKAGENGQCISDSVVEGYIVNTRPLRNKCLHCLMTKGASKEMAGRAVSGLNLQQKSTCGT